MFVIGIAEPKHQQRITYNQVITLIISYAALQVIIFN